MFTPAVREAIRSDLIERARNDPRISGGALTGSASADAEDAWSDIDLAFGVRDASDMAATIADFTDHMYRAHGARDQVDVVREPWVYRVFLLPNTLQVDLAFAPATHYGARAPTFRLLFGEATDVPHVPPPDRRELIGLGWLYALHVRSSVVRSRPWQAEYMLSAMRDQVLSLACLRFGLPAREGRGIDRLPPEVVRPLEDALVRGLGRDDLIRAFRATSDALMIEIEAVDAALADRVGPVLTELVQTSTG